MKLHKLAFILLIIGGLNWGLTGIGYNVVENVLGQWPTLVMVIYVLVGLSAVYELVSHKGLCKNCSM